MCSYMDLHACMDIAFACIAYIVFKSCISILNICTASKCDGSLALLCHLDTY